MRGQAVAPSRDRCGTQPKQIVGIGCHGEEAMVTSFLSVLESVCFYVRLRPMLAAPALVMADADLVDISLSVG